jgi:hypothetical protein
MTGAYLLTLQKSLKAVLLHNGKTVASIQIAHSIHLKETYQNLRIVLEKMKYREHNWNLCSNMKILGMLLGQGGYTKFPCFVCEWDSITRDKHWTTKDWSKREDLIPGSKNAVYASLVDKHKILLPPLHIKLGIMKQFVKALDRRGSSFQYLSIKFPTLSEAKVKEGIFEGPQIRKPTKNAAFMNTMNNVQHQAWNAFTEDVQKILGNVKDPRYKEIVGNMLEKLTVLG